MAKASLVSRERKGASFGKRGALSLEPTEFASVRSWCPLWDWEAEMRDGSCVLRTGPVTQCAWVHSHSAHEPPGSKDTEGSKVEDVEGVGSSGEDLGGLTEVCQVGEKLAKHQS